MTLTRTWRSSLTLSMGATAVLEMAAAVPPAKKSLAKEMAVSPIFRCYQTLSARWGLPVELKWPTPSWRRADLKGPAARKTVNSDSRFRLAVSGGWWAALVDALRFRYGTHLLATKVT